MSNFDNTNRAVLFENDRKESDTHPDMKGSININGVDHWLSGWWKDGAKGRFLSMSIGKPKEARQEQRPPNRPPQRSAPSRSANAPSGGGFDDWDDSGRPF